MPFRDLEKQGALQIMVYLYEHRDRRINVSELDKNIKASRETILSTLELLKINRLIEEELNSKFPFDHSAWLNEKGVEVGAHLKVAQSLLDPKHPRKTSDVEPAK